MFELIVLVLLNVTSLFFSVLAFLGKNIILDDAYLKASKEERETMNKKAYRLQAAIIFLFLAGIFALNAFRAILSMPLFTYLAIALGIVGMIYAGISHYKLKRK